MQKVKQCCTCFNKLFRCKKQPKQEREADKKADEQPQDEIDRYVVKELQIENLVSPQLVNDGRSSPKVTSGGPYNATNAHELFNKYKAEGSQLMQQEQIEKFFSDLGINAETDIVCLMAIFAMKCAHFGELRLHEFLRGC